MTLHSSTTLHDSSFQMREDGSLIMMETSQKLWSPTRTLQEICHPNHTNVYVAVCAASPLLRCVVLDDVLLRCVVLDHVLLRCVLWRAMFHIYEQCSLAALFFPAQFITHFGKTSFRLISIWPVARKSSRCPHPNKTMTLVAKKESHKNPISSFPGKTTALTLCSTRASCQTCGKRYRYTLAHSH